MALMGVGMILSFECLLYPLAVQNVKHEHPTLTIADKYKVNLPIYHRIGSKEINQRETS